MNKKLIALLLATATAVSCTAVTACSPSGNGTDGGDTHTHSYVNYTSDNNATCTQDGTKTATCTHEGCNEKDVIADTGSKLGHDFTNYVSDGNATCTADGTKSAVCNRTGCNAKDVITEEGSAGSTGHKYAEGWSKDDDFHWHAATCGCADAPLDKKTHTFVDNTCTECGHFYVPQSKLEFKLNDDGESYEIIGIGEFEDTVLNIPSTYKDKPVTKIAENAFLNSDWITEASVPEGISEVNGFNGCTSLRKVTLAESVTSIGFDAFNRCTSLKEINFPENLTEIKGYAFADCSSLPEALTIGGNKLTSIGNNAFYWCPFTEISLPKSVTDMGEDVFEGCPVEIATLPACATLQNNDTLVTLNIHFGTLIPTKAYYNCTKLESVTIEEQASLSEGYCTISDYAFAKCTSLKNMIMGSGIRRIGDFVFSNCPLLEKLYLSTSIKYTGILFDLGVYPFAPEFLETKEYVFTASEYGYTALHFKNAAGKADYSYLLEFMDKDATSVNLYNHRIIGYMAFYKCTNLTKVTIPKGVSCIMAAFESSVNQFVYEGTKAEWEAIEKQEDWDYNLPSYTVKCKNGTITVNK